MPRSATRTRSRMYHELGVHSADRRAAGRRRRDARHAMRALRRLRPPAIPKTTFRCSKSSDAAPAWRFTRRDSLRARTSRGAVVSRGFAPCDAAESARPGVRCVVRAGPRRSASRRRLVRRAASCRRPRRRLHRRRRGQRAAAPRSRWATCARSSAASRKCTPIRRSCWTPPIARCAWSIPTIRHGVRRRARYDQTHVRRTQVAGHPPPMLRHADGTIDLLSERRITAGLAPSHARRTANTIELAEPGCTLVFYTDGLDRSSSHARPPARCRLRESLATMVLQSPNAANSLARRWSNACCPGHRTRRRRDPRAHRRERLDATVAVDDVHCSAGRSTPSDAVRRSASRRAFAGGSPTAAPTSIDVAHGGTRVRRTRRATRYGTRRARVEVTVDWSAARTRCCTCSTAAPASATLHRCRPTCSANPVAVCSSCRR